MKQLLNAVLGIYLSATLASSHFLLPSFASRRQAILNRGAATHQSPIMNTFDAALPPSQKDNAISGAQGPVVLSDIMGKERSINIFAGYTREIEAVSKLLEDHAENTTVLAPLNSAIQAMPRKPWEDQNDYVELGAQAYDGSDGFDRAQANLRRFVEAHVVPVAPWSEKEKAETIGGMSIWWESRDGKRFVGKCGTYETMGFADRHRCRFSLGMPRYRAWPTL